VNDSYLILEGGELVDGNGGPPISNAVLVIKGDRIEAVGTSETIKIPKGAEIIDTSRKTIIPGLIDAHLHLIGIRDLNPRNWIAEPSELKAMRATMDTWKVIDCGFTTVRDCGNYPNGVLLKKAVAEGSIIGPRILSCGVGIYPTHWAHMDVLRSVPVDWIKERAIFFNGLADGVEECRKMVREQLREGADFIKTFDMFTAEEIKAVVDEAHHAGVKAAVHVAHDLESAKRALKAQPDTIEHGSCLDDEAIEMMLKQGTYLIPTLAIDEAWERRASKKDMDEAMLIRIQSRYKLHREAFEKAWKAGVKIWDRLRQYKRSLTPDGGKCA